MKTREEALKFGLSFKSVYEEKPFHDPNWQLIRRSEDHTCERQWRGR